MTDSRPGVPHYTVSQFWEKRSDYCLLIPIINEKGHIEKELKRAMDAHVHEKADIIICDGDSTDGCTDHSQLRALGVCTLLVKKDTGKQGAQLRMGFDWALQQGYRGILTIDGNNKDSIEDVPRFIEKLEDGYDFIQGSRFCKGGKAINTPLLRLIMVKLVHAPVISLTARQRFTDSTNAFRGYSARYIAHPEVDVFRDIFDSYELLAYLSVRASQLKLQVCEIPVTRAYPKHEKTPTKIKGWKGNFNLLRILILNLFSKYTPSKGK